MFGFCVQCITLVWRKYIFLQYYIVTFEQSAFHGEFYIKNLDAFLNHPNPPPPNQKLNIQINNIDFILL